MKTNKKYILFILFLFSSASVSPSSLSDIYMNNIYTTIKMDTIIWHLIIPFIVIYATYRIAHKNIPLIAKLLNKKLCQTVFQDNDYHYGHMKCQLDKEYVDKIKSYIEKYRVAIPILLKFLLCVEYDLTQEHYISYIKSICFNKRYQEMQSIVLFLFESGINPRFSISADQSLLTEACLYKDSQGLVEYLIETLKLDPNDRDRQVKHDYSGDVDSGISIRDASDPLSVACYENNTYVVKLLIKHNTHTHPFLDLDPKSTPPILRAIKHKNIEMFRDLFLYTAIKTMPTSFLHKTWQLKQVMENRDLQKKIANIFINLSITKPGESLLDSCFTCDEKIWLPHGTRPNLYIGRIRLPVRLDKNAPITNKDGAYNKKVREEIIPNIKKKVQKFLPRLQISS